MAEAEVKADGYILFDTKTGKPWDLRVYTRKGDAGNSYNANKNYLDGRWNPDVPSWKNQTRVVAKPIRIIDMETGQHFT